MRLKSASNGKMLVVVTLFAFVASCVANEANYQSAMKPLQAAANSTFIKESSGEERGIPLSFIDHNGMEGVFVDLEDTKNFLEALKAKGIDLKPEDSITHIERKGIYLNSEHFRKIMDLEDSFGAIVTIFRESAGEFATAKFIAGGRTSTETKEWAQRLKTGLLRQWIDEEKTSKEILQLLEIKGKSPSQLLQDPLFLLWVDFVMMSFRVKKYKTLVYENYEIKAQFLNEAAQLQKEIDLLEKEWERFQPENIRLTKMKNDLQSNLLYYAKDRLQEETDKVENLSSRFKEKTKYFNQHWDDINTEKTAYNGRQLQNYYQRLKFISEDDKAFKAMIKVLAEQGFEHRPVTDLLASVLKKKYQIDLQAGGYISNGKVQKFD